MGKGERKGGHPHSWTVIWQLSKVTSKISTLQRRIPISTACAPDVPVWSPGPCRQLYGLCHSPVTDCLNLGLTSVKEKGIIATNCCLELLNIHCLRKRHPQNLAVILKPVLTISQWSLANNTLSTSVGNQCYIQTDLTPPPSVDLTPNGLYGCKDWIVPTLGCWRWSWSHFPSKNLLEELRSLLGAHCRPGVRSVWPEKKWEENSTWLSSDKTTNEHLPSFSSSLKKNETNQPSHTLYPQ